MGLDFGAYSISIALSLSRCIPAGGQMPPARGNLSSMGPSKGPSIDDVLKFLVFSCLYLCSTYYKQPLLPHLFLVTPPLPRCQRHVWGPSLQQRCNFPSDCVGLSLSADADDGRWSWWYGRRQRRAFFVLSQRSVLYSWHLITDIREGI